ncbi:hypothetical protein [Mycobacteroides chelonae]|uniref:hypothetical protein n=1 Tax=Mycobacteroides chelonae TaxID=1774 RepID=UPI000693A1D2|nr:hypothetical protein [Mycobacteroides chelonae]MBF9319827.1 hypothetical protein [Mycobacteroides chelonae]OHT73649.1 hypothetical protein BKG66_05035 [Mycobacteroides chelonae]OHT76206.1 hypothetical protein BKG67_01875 [Mycobacteroides chelonae]OHT91497.1 hypothetical protein BKG70_02055 [Mycobacteroides chelonae]
MIAKRRTKLGLPPVSPLMPSAAGAPKAKASQAELRDRRRKRLPIHLTGTFNLAVEVRDVCTPAAYATSKLPEPRAARRLVEAVNEAVAELVHVGSGVAAASSAVDGQTRRAAADLAARPTQPEITAEMLISGSWADVLADYAEQVSGALSVVLDRAHPPDAYALRGELSASERLERALRALDSAVLSLERAVPKIAQRQSLPSIEDWNRQQRERQATERAERVTRRLARIGAPT